MEFDVAGGTFGIGSFGKSARPAPRATLAERGVTVDAPYELEWCSIAVVRDRDGNAIRPHRTTPR